MKYEQQSDVLRKYQHDQNISTHLYLPHRLPEFRDLEVIVVAAVPQGPWMVEEQLLRPLLRRQELTDTITAMG